MFKVDSNVYIPPPRRARKAHLGVRQQALGLPSLVAIFRLLPEAAQGVVTAQPPLLKQEHVPSSGIINLF